MEHHAAWCHLLNKEMLGIEHLPAIGTSVLSWRGHPQCSPKPPLGRHLDLRGHGVEPVYEFSRRMTWPPARMLPVVRGFGDRARRRFVGESLFPFLRSTRWLRRRAITVRAVGLGVPAHVVRPRALVRLPRSHVCVSRQVKRHTLGLRPARLRVSRCRRRCLQYRTPQQLADRLLSVEHRHIVKVGRQLIRNMRPRCEPRNDQSCMGIARRMLRMRKSSTEIGQNHKRILWVLRAPYRSHFG